MAKNDSDFYVKFGSNATEWARGLDAQLAPANRTLAALQATMNRLDRQGEGLRTKLAADLAQRGAAAGTPDGRVAAGSGNTKTSYIQHQLEEAANAASDMMTQINAAVRTLQQLPAATTRILNQINGSINQGGGVRSDQYRNQNTGVFGTAGGAGNARAQVLDILKANERASRTTGPSIPPTSIAGVGSQAVNEAGFNRIVAALEAQTKTLTKALGNVKVTGSVATEPSEGGTATRPAKTGKSAKAAAAPVEGDLDDAMTGLRKDVADLRGLYAQAVQVGKSRLAGIGREFGEDSKEYATLKAQLDAADAALRSRIAKTERAAEGIGRGEQSSRNQAEAQKVRDDLAARPAISEREMTRRLEDQARIATAAQLADPDYRKENVGRRQNQLGGADLREMQRVFAESGVETGIKGSDKLAVMAEKLGVAAQRFNTLYSDGLPENLKTEGLNKYRETQVAPGVERMLALANDDVIQALAKQRQADIDTVTADRRGGGLGPRDRGRREFGSGLITEKGRLSEGPRDWAQSVIEGIRQGPLPQNYSNTLGVPRGDGGFSANEVLEAEKRLSETARDHLNTTTDLLRTPGFDPYDSDQTRVKPGTTPEEIERANATRLFVRQVREMTTEIDKSGRAYVLAGDEIEDFTRKIDDIQSRLLRSANTPKGEEGYLGNRQERKLEEEQDRLRAQRENAMRFRSQERGTFGDLFDDPNYRAGMEQRTQSRAAYEQRAEERRINPQISTYSDLRTSTGLYLQRQMGGQGLGFNSRSGQIFAKDQNLSGKTLEKLNNALGSFTTRFVQSQQNNTFIGPQTEKQFNASEKAEGEMEEAAAKLLRRIASAFNGLAPDFESLTGVQPKDLKNIQAEAERADTRAVGKEAAKTPATSPEQKSLQLQEQLQRAEQRLQQARDEESAAKLAARQKEDEFRQGLSQLDPLDAQAATAARERLAQAATERSALNNMRYLQENKFTPAKDDGERYVMREPSVNSKLDTLGYPAQYGYAPAVDDERKRLDTEIAELVAQLSKIYPDNRSPEEQNDAFLKNADKLEELQRLRDENPKRIDAIADARGEGDLKENSGYHAAREDQQRALARIAQLEIETTGAAALEHNKLNEEVGFATSKVKNLEAEVEKLGNRAQAAAKKVGNAAEAEEQKTRATEAPGASDADLDAKRAQYETARQLAKDYKAANAAAKAARGTDAYAELRAKADAIKAQPGYLGVTPRNALYREIRDGAGGAGGGGARTTEPGPGDNGILGRILAAINQVNTTLKGGVRVSGGKIDTTPTSGSGTRSKRDPELVAKEDALIAKNVPGGQAALDAIAAERQSQAGKERSTTATTKATRETARATRETDKKAAAERESIQAAEQLAAAEKLVGREAREAADDLKRAAASGDAKQITAAQTKLYGAVDADLYNKNISGTDRRGVAKTLINANGPTVNENELNSIRRTSRLQNPVSMLDRQWAEQVPDPDASVFMRAMGDMFGNRGFWGRIVGSTGAFVVRNFAAGAVFGITNSLQQVLDQALLTEMTFVRVQQALEATDKPIGSLRSDLMNISTDYGIALNDVYNSAASLQGLFENTEDLAAATRVSTQLQVISGGALNAAEAVGVLASTYTAFAKGPSEEGFLDVGAIREGQDGLTRIADTLTLIQNELGVNIETTAEGISSMAGAAESLGLNFQETAVYVAQISKLTNQTGAASGEQFSRILGAAQTGRGRGVLRDSLAGVTSDDGRDLGAAVNSALAANDMGAVIENLLLSWNKLSKSQQSNIAVTIAGQRQMRSFQALMHDSTKTVDLLSDSYTANGDAEDRMEALMRTLNKQVDVLMGNFQNLASALVQTGILNFFLVLFVGINKVLELMNSLLSKFNEFAEANPLVGQLRDLTTFAIGAAVAFKLLGSSVTGLKGALAQQRGRQLPDAALRPGGVQAPFSPVLRAPTRREALDSPDANRAYRSNLARPVTRPNFSEFRGGTIGAGGRGFNFLVDRSFRVPAERLGKNIERGGVRFANSSNLLGRNLAQLATKVGGATSAGAQGLGAILQGNDPRGLRDPNAASRGDMMRGLALQNRQLYEDQKKYSSYTGSAANMNRSNLQGRWLAAGMSQEDVDARSTAPRRSTLALARVQEGAARTSDKLSGSLGKVGAGMASVAGSGLAFEAALAGVGLAIAGFVAYGARMKEFREAFNESADTFNLPKPGEKEESTPDYLGAADKATREAAQRYQDDGVGYFENLGAALKTKDFYFDSEAFGAALTGKENDPQRSQEQFVGLDSDALTEEGRAWMEDLAKINEELVFTFKDKKGLEYALEGVNEAGALVNNTQKSLDQASSGQLGFIPDAVAGVQEQFLKDLEAEKNRIEEDASLDDAQRTAALANLESVRSAMTKQIANARAMAEGIGQTISLTSDQINSLSSVMDLSNTIAKGGGTVGGININDVLRAEIANVGAEQGSELDAILDKIATGGLSQAKLAVADVEILRIGVKNARSNYFAALAVDPGSEETSTAKGDLMNAINALATASEQKVQEIVDNAEQLAVIAEASGNYAKAAAIRAAAIIKAEAVKDAAAPDPVAGVNEAADAPRGFSKPETGENKKGKKRRKRSDPAYVQGFQSVVNNAIYLATKDIELAIAQTSDQAKIAGLRLLQAQIENTILAGVNSGAGIPSASDLPPKVGDAIGNIPGAVVDNINSNADDLGAAAVTEQQVHDSVVGLADAQTSYADASTGTADAAKAAAAEARQNAAALRQARLGVAAAWADARGDAVASAKIQVAMAAASMQAARAELAAATTASESAQARIAVLNAQAQLIGAQAAVQAAQQDLVQSQYQVSIALAEAAGNTVEAASRSLSAARAALRAAMKKSGGKATAEVNAAKAAVIAAQAAQRDAALQDQLDTIDFNLEMGKTTQAAAISALQQILRNKELTKQQRRQLLLQIKGMKDELADSQWNFGDINLPTPYEMRRYIAERRDQFKGQLDQAATGGRGGKPIPRDLQFELGGGQKAPPGSEVKNYGSLQGNTTTIYINGADTGKVKKIIRDAVGSSNSINTRTTGARRGGR